MCTRERETGRRVMVTLDRPETAINIGEDMAKERRRLLPNDAR